MTDREFRGPECPDAVQLAAFADGGMSPAERQRIETHLAGCEECYDAFVEVTAITAALAAPAATASPVRAPHSRTRRSFLWIGGTLATAAAVVLALNLWSSSRPDALDVALSDLIQAPRAARLGFGRLSVDRAWAPASSVRRSGDAGAAALDGLPVKSAAQSLKVIAAGDRSRRGLHAYGLALVASREHDAAIDALTQALLQSGSDDATIRSDLAAVWLDRYQHSGRPADAERALAEADRALAHTPTHLQAAFNRALALDELGRPQAREAWQAYIDLDRNAAARWVDEATWRRDRLR